MKAVIKRRAGHLVKEYYYLSILLYMTSMFHVNDAWIFR